MNHKKIKKQIKKVNSFFESITDDGEVSRIEKDLLLSYVRKLYESILDQDENVVSKPAKTKKQVLSTPTPVIVKKEAKTPVPERKPFERAEPVQATVEEFEVTSPQQAVQVETSATENVSTHEAQAEVLTAVLVKEAKPVLSDKMASVFEKTGGNELSDKLGNLPIKDLTKAMGINERMFTIKELFGGNQDKFKTVMSTINKLSSYEEAKEYLLNGVATELEWDSEDNYKKADKFVKLVQRRFS